MAKAKFFHIGFTGTQNGMTDKQSYTLETLLEPYKGPFTIFIHGDCFGADREAAKRAKDFDMYIVVRPGCDKNGNEPKRAFTWGDEIHPTKPYLERNKDIVNDSDILIACPEQEEEQLRSGTWSTIRNARKRNKTVYIILPNGQVRMG